MRQCHYPKTIRPNGPDGSSYIVPCRKCPACDLNKIAQWVTRCEYELKAAHTAYFITLTYSDENCPIAVHTTGEYDYSLKKRDYQLFLMKLRQYPTRGDIPVPPIYFDTLKTKKIRYVIAGEYGEKTERPHYHLLLWNFPYNIVQTLKIVEKVWQKGFVHIGKIEPRSINYVVSYIVQKRGWKKFTQPPFLEMSRRPGIGHSYLEKNAEYHLRDPKNFTIRSGPGRKAMPAYYARKLYTDDFKTEVTYEKIQANQAYKEKLLAEIEKGRDTWENWFEQQQERDRKAINHKIKVKENHYKPINYTNHELI